MGRDRELHRIFHRQLLVHPHSRRLRALSSTHCSDGSDSGGGLRSCLMCCQGHAYTAMVRGADDRRELGWLIFKWMTNGSTYHSRTIIALDTPFGRSTGFRTGRGWPLNSAEIVLRPSGDCSFQLFFEPTWSA